MYIASGLLIETHEGHSHIDAVEMAITDSISPKVQRETVVI